MKRSMTVGTLALVAVLGLPLYSAQAAPDNDDAGTDAFTDHGVAAPVSRARGVAAVEDGNGVPIVAAWSEDRGKGARFMLLIDAETGETEHHEVPFDTWDAPFGIVFASDNVFYALFGHHFAAFDVTARSFSHIEEVEDRVAMAMWEAPDGTIFAGTYPDAHLYEFDPQTQTLKDHGPLNDENWPQYPRAIAFDDDGWLYMSIGTTRTQIVAYNLDGGEIRSFVDEQDRRQGTAIVRPGVDGRVYGRANIDEPWYQYYRGEQTQQLEGDPEVEFKSQRSGRQDSVFDEFPDGRRLATYSHPDRYMVIENPDTDETQRVTFDYESAGALIYSLVKGPHGQIHGSTGHPLRVFSFDPDTGDFTENGLRGMNGHLNTMVTFHDKVVGALYTGGSLQIWDPQQPWRDEEEQDPNPRATDESRPHVNRPHAMIVHPDQQHIITTGTPGYGHTGGGMSIDDSQTDEMNVYSDQDLIPDQSTTALVALDEHRLVGGTTIRPGTGGEQLAEAAELYTYDWDERAVSQRVPFEPEVESIRDLIATPAGDIYGLTSDGHLFTFDADAGEVTGQSSLQRYGEPTGGQAARVMAIGPDEDIYILMQDAIVRVRPGTLDHRQATELPVEADAGIVIDNGQLYFTSGSSLWSYQLPSAQ